MITTGQKFLTVDDNHRYSGMNSYQQVTKPLNELGRSSCDGYIYVSKPSTSSTSARDVQPNDFPLSINQTFDDMMVEDKLSKKKSTDILSANNHNSSNVKLTTNNLLRNDTNRISEYGDMPMRMTQSLIGTKILPNFKNKFEKLQLTTNFECHDYDEQILCKKIELKKYIEFDTSSFWNKK